MADNLRTFATPCMGGLVVNQDPLTQGSQMAGSALRLINYEPALNGGYRRISGYKNSYGELTGLANSPVLKPMEGEPEDMEQLLMEQKHWLHLK